MNPPVFGITGWKNSGKTTLAAGLISELTRRGYAVTALKHAHESFDIDQPGRDSIQATGSRRPARGAILTKTMGGHARAPGRTGSAGSRSCWLR